MTVHQTPGSRANPLPFESWEGDARRGSPIITREEEGSRKVDSASDLTNPPSPASGCKKEEEGTRVLFGAFHIRATAERVKPTLLGASLVS